jgi:uncharacterized integral membrane protein
MPATLLRLTILRSLRVVGILLHWSFGVDAMRYLNWFLRAVLFVALLGFAVKNDQPVTLRYFFGYEWQSSLVIVLLIFFAAGAAVGVLAMLANVLQQRREIARLKRDIRVKNKLAGVGETQQIPIQPS